MLKTVRFQSPEGLFPITGFEVALLFLRLDYLRIGKVRKFGIGMVLFSKTHTLWLNVEE